MLNFRARKVLISPTDHNYRLEVKLDKLAVSKYLDKNQKITTTPRKVHPAVKMVLHALFTLHPNLTMLWLLQEQG